VSLRAQRGNPWLRLIVKNEKSTGFGRDIHDGMRHIDCNLMSLAGAYSYNLVNCKVDLIFTLQAKEKVGIGRMWV